MVARLPPPSWEYKYPRRGIFENPVVWPILYAGDATTRLIEVVGVAGRLAQRWVWVNVAIGCGGRRPWVGSPAACFDPALKRHFIVRRQPTTHRLACAPLLVIPGPPEHSESHRWPLSGSVVISSATPPSLFCSHRLPPISTFGLSLCQVATAVAYLSCPAEAHVRLRW